MCPTNILGRFGKIENFRFWSAAGAAYQGVGDKASFLYIDRIFSTFRLFSALNVLKFNFWQQESILWTILGLVLAIPKFFTQNSDSKMKIANFFAIFTFSMMRVRACACACACASLLRIVRAYHSNPAQKRANHPNTIICDELFIREGIF